MTLKRSFKFSVDWVNSGPRRAILGKFESPFPHLVKHSQTLSDTLRHSQTLSDTLRPTDSHQRMSAVTFEVTFSAPDILRDPQIRKALREREDTYLDNISWLDEDLDKKVEKRYQENIAWLDQDLAEKRYQENIAWLDQDLANKVDEEAAVTIQKYARRMIVMDTIASASASGGMNGLLTMGPSGNLRVPKIWHCGHGSKWGRPDGKEEKKKMAKRYEEGLEKNTCFIHHGYDEHSGRGYNTTKQMKNFQGHAKEGDVIFTHCAAKGGLTHYGFFTGEIIQEEVQDREDRENNRTSIQSHICVYGWIPLPEVVKGVGRNCTLYEVTPTNKKGVPTKNFQNYIRAALGITSS